MSAVRAAGFTLAALVLSSPALAAGPTPADREAARALATRGYELFEGKDYPHAIESFEKAESRIHAPPHWLYIARSQAKLGKLLAAKATYERIVAEKLPDGSPLPFRDAQTSARSELGEVNVLIPSIELTLAGVGAASATVRLDDQPFPASAMGQSYPADPGLHTFVVTFPGSAPIERTVAVKADGVTEHVNIALDPAPARSVAPIVVAFTLGGLALGAGGATLGLFYGSTPRSNALRIASIAGFAAGGLGVGAGIVLLAVRPSSGAATKPASPQINAMIGPGSLGLAGTF
ncbi:MAG: tetratricopeptide repeat protein [Byssovorax sp.]